MEVKGHVNYRGAATPSGSVTFFPQTGRPIMAPLTDGRYSAELPPGQYTVVVGISLELPPGFKEGDKVPPPKMVLPAEYTTRAKSKLSVTVGESGPLEQNFELK